MRNIIMIKPISSAIHRTQCKNIFQKLTNNILRTKKNQSIANLKYVVPYVAVPIVAYNTKTDANERKLAQNLEKGKAHTPVTDNTETNTKALRKAGIRKKDINKELDKDGNLKNESTKKDLDSKKISHKGAPDDQHFEPADASYNGETYGDMPKVYEPETGIQGISQHAEIPNFDDAISGTPISASLAEVADMLDNPILTGVAAELLPGTKFLKPAKDLFDGDFEKAAVGTATRAGEILVSPFKLGWAAFGAFSGTVSWLAGNRGEGTGFFGGAKRASLMWAKQRNKAENAVLGREEADPDKGQKEKKQIYEEATQKDVDNIRTSTRKAIERENEIRKKDAEQSSKELEALKGTARRKAQEADRISARANSRIQENNAQVTNARQYYQQLIIEKNNSFKYMQDTMAQIDSEISNARAHYDKKLQQELTKQKAILERQMKQVSDEVLANANYIIETVRKYEALYQKTNHKGFGKIAGYDNIKQELTKMFGVPLLKKQNVPNAILLYGQKGSGKNLFGAAMATQFDCYDGGSMLLKIGDDLNFDKLMEIAEDARAKFVKTGKRTIIQINEVEYFGNNQTTSFFKRLKGRPKNFAEFLSNCADKYGCTIMASTNSPEEIDKPVLEQMKPLYVPPANRDDIAKILKHHVDGKETGKIDYEKLADKLIEKAGNGAFSNARLENIVYKVKTTYKMITQELLEDEINQRMPDISREDIEVYAKRI